MCCCLKCLHCTALQLISACSLRAWSPVVGLKDKIPGIIDISTGTFQLPRRRVWRCMTTRLASTGCSFTARHKGYTHCLVARLKDKASLEVYQNHVAHLDLLKELAVHVENVLAGRGRCRAAQPCTAGVPDGVCRCCLQWTSCRLATPVPRRVRAGLVVMPCLTGAILTPAFVFSPQGLPLLPRFWRVCRSVSPQWCCGSKAQPMVL